MMKTLRRTSMEPVALVAALVSCAGVTPAIAASDVFLQLKNPDIKGSSKDELHKDWIEVSAPHFAVSAETSYLKGTGASIGKPIPTALSWTQSMDSSVPALANQMTAGKALGTAKFEFMRQTSPAGSRIPSPYMTITAKDALLTDLSYAFTPDEVPQVDASTVYKSIELAYQPDSAGGKPGGTITTNWDVVTGKVTTLGTAITTLPGTGSPSHGSGLFLRFASSPTSAIAGESKILGYENWIQVNDAAWGMSAESSWLKGGGASVGKAMPDTFSWTQAMDQSVPFTLAAIASGKPLPTATLEYVVNGGSGPVTLMQMVMEAPFLTELDLAEGSVSQSMVFRSINQTVWTLDKDGKAGTPTSFKWNFSNSKTQGLESPEVKSFGSGGLGGALAAASVEAPLPAAPIPEPGTWAMMLGGLAVLGGVAHWRRRTA